MNNIKWFKGRSVPVKTEVKAYYNLHKHLFSFVALEGEYKGKVVGHAESLTLIDVNFKVSKAGRERVLKEQRKNVHAFVTGKLCDSESPERLPKVIEIIEKQGLGTWVSYNPYKADHFYSTKTGERVDSGSIVMLLDKKVWVS